MNFFDEIPIKMAENAAFLWLLHDQAINSPGCDLARLIELEERIDAQLEGLLLHGEAGWKACEAALQFEDTGEVFTAAVLAFSSGNNEWIQKAVETGCLKPKTYQALLSALSWLPLETVKSWIIKLVQADNPAYLCLGVCACALHGVHCGEILNTALNNQQLKNTPEYLSRLIRSAGIMQRTDLLPMIQRHIKDENAHIAYSSIFASLLLGDKSQISLLKPAVFDNTSLTDSAINLTFRALPKTEAKAWARELSETPGNRRQLISAIGVVGDPTALPWLIEQMSNEHHARLAGHSFSMITGLDLEKNNMTKASVILDVAELDDDDRKRPWPDDIKVREWYERNCQNFVTEQRYLAGEIINEESLQKVLLQGKQTQRAAARLELQLNYGVTFTNEAPRRLRI